MNQDATEVQQRKPSPQVKLLSQITWPEPAENIRSLPSCPPDNTAPGIAVRAAVSPRRFAVDVGSMSSRSAAASRATRTASIACAVVRIVAPDFRTFPATT